jgi:hypothetical protein
MLTRMEAYWLELIKKNIYKVLPDGRILNLISQKEVCKLNKGETVTLSFCHNGILGHTTKPRAIWLALKGEIPEGYLVSTKDGSRNFAIDNLELITRSEKNLRAPAGGRSKGSKPVNVKMTDAHVEDMRKRYAEKPFDLDVEKDKFGYRTAKSIKNALLGLSFSHLTVPPVTNMERRKRKGTTRAGIKMPTLTVNKPRRVPRAKPVEENTPKMSTKEVIAQHIAEFKKPVEARPVPFDVKSKAARFLAFRARKGS